MSKVTRNSEFCIVVKAPKSELGERWCGAKLNGKVATIDAYGMPELSASQCRKFAEWFTRAAKIIENGGKK